jgi:hypothetical protein
MQKTTIIISTAYVESVANDPLRADKFEGDEETVDMAEDIGAEFEENDLSRERGLISYLIASLGKLVGLSTQLVGLISALGDEVVATGKPATPSIDISKIILLMDEVSKLYGSWGKYGMARSLAIMVKGLYAVGQYPPQIDVLLNMWETSNKKARSSLEKIQTNQYVAEYKNVNIPSKTTDIVRRAEIASGRENRDFTGAEYKLLMELREQGLLSGDDFTSVYSGYDSDEGSLSSSNSDDESSFVSGSSGTSYYAPSMSSNARSSRSGFSNLPPLEFVYQDVRMPDSDDESDYSGAGLYSIPASKRYPLVQFH